MASDWSIDLLLAIDETAGRGIGLEQALRAAIRDGRLAAGTRLPSTRALACDLGWARGTVAGAYTQLAAEGWLSARAGAGTVVAAGREIAPSAGPEAAERRSPRYDLTTGSPDVASFPRRAWSAALRHALRGAADEALRLGDPRGRLELRAALAAYLGRARGVVATPERIVLCSGYVQALALLTAVMGRTVAMEDPCLGLHREVVTAAGLRVAPLPVDDDGARVETLDADAVVVTPAHQIGLGSTLAPERRAALAAWDGVVIEDDYDGEFRYDGRPVGALQALAPDRIVYAGTASKALSPALRIAWLVVPERLLEAVVEAKRLADSASPALDQLALARLIETGELDRHLRRMRTRYRRRRDAVVAALPDVRVLGIAAGLHVTVELPAGAASEAEILEAARDRSLAVTGLSSFWHAPAERPTCLQVGYAAPPDHAFPGAVDALAGVMRAAASPGS